MKNTVDLPLGVDIQGNLIASDLGIELLAGEVKGQAPEDFGLAKTDKLVDEIATAWGDAKIYWAAFQRAISRLPEDEPATTATREQWVIPLLKSLGYDPIYVAKAEVVESQTYAISHRAEQGENKPPVHIVGCRVRLEQRPPSGTPRLSAHALVQEYLNRTEHLWAVVTNGLRWRLLRDTTLMTRLTYVEFDLEQILNGENFAEFGLFYRLFHRSRLPEGMDDADECLLEFYHQESLQQGGRVRDRLRDGVEAALKILGTGFLQHPQSKGLRDKFESEILTERDFYRQLLMLIYRLLFLMVAESRNLLLSTEDPEKARVYREYYSIERLRALAERPSWRREGYQDLWQGLRVTFQLFDENWRGQLLSLSPLDGDLFGSHTLGDLDDCSIDNHDLTLALRKLSLYEQKAQLRRVNYGALDVEELGSVYESLLDFHPRINQRDGVWEFQLVTGSDRKTTGSYYTPPELVGQLIKSALEPVIADCLKALGPNTTQEGQEEALLKLKICDPACGSGHFLLAAARRIGKELARVRTGETQPGQEPLRLAIRDVIQHCIYGVDLNPLAVDLCKVALWLEGLCCGLSLNFLDHRIKCGNSLVGVLDLSCLQKGIPDGAYKPVTGDDKSLAAKLKKRNKIERETTALGQLPLMLDIYQQDRDEYAKAWNEIECIKDDDPLAVRRKQSHYKHSRNMLSWKRDQLACNLWTAAFFMPLIDQNMRLFPTSEILENFIHENILISRILELVNELAEETQFFHWPLEFPDVFEDGGFNCILGNPPWETIKIQEKEFFTSRDSRISNANKSERAKLIRELKITDHNLISEFLNAKRFFDCQGKFIRESKRYPFTAFGDINTYTLFTETSWELLCPKGRVGCIVPPGIATDDSTKLFIQMLLEKQAISSFYDFTNRGYIFRSLESTHSFSLITLSRLNCSDINLAAQLWKVDDLKAANRRYKLTKNDINLLNPNTRNLPILRTKVDARIIKKIYLNISVLENQTSEDNPWNIRFSAMFHMSADAEIFFKTKDDLETQFSLQGNIFVNGKDVYLPLYESKFIGIFNHRESSFDNLPKEKIYGTRPKTNKIDDGKLKLFDTSPLPRYWVSEKEISSRIPSSWNHDWLIGFRNAISSVADSRTVRFAIIPKFGVGHSMPLIFSTQNINLLCALVGNFNALVLDYVAKQKASGGNLKFYVIRQLPILAPCQYSQPDIEFISLRILELTYTAWDLQPFAQDIGYDREPFIWNSERRALLRAELDAYYAYLYGLTRDELRYILDPSDVYGPNFPCETFHVLKNKEMKKFGEYRTQRLVLEAWDKLFG